MGLMLSVLVFCVGVVEALDCWHHFMFHLVTPSRRALPHRVDPKVDILSVTENRRPSHVDICWPKDLSPTDDLHVIKKRTHSENERRSDHERERRSVSIEKDVDHHRNLSKLEVHNPDLAFSDSPQASRENSPSQVELEVIIESDSSEPEELSQIENVSQNDRVINELPNSKEDCSKIHYETIDSKIVLSRPISPAPSHSPEEIISQKSEESISPEQDRKLPQFTNQLLNDNVQKVPTSHSNEDISKVPAEDICLKNEKGGLLQQMSTTSSGAEEFEDADSTTRIGHSVPSKGEGVQEKQHFPEIKLHESSPISVEESSDSSVNTSDASWMAKSRTSDRPLLVRFSTSPEEMAKDFRSVTQTDLQAFSSNDPILKTERCDEVEVNISESSKLTSDSSIVPADEILQESDSSFKTKNGKPESSEVNELPNEQRAQPETNSSSSSLSGIPQIPEDIRDNLSLCPIPHDNGFGQAQSGQESFDSEALTKDTSNTHSDNVSISTEVCNVSSTGISNDGNEVEICNDSSVPSEQVGTKDEIKTDVLISVEAPVNQAVSIDNSDTNGQVISDSVGQSNKDPDSGEINVEDFSGIKEGTITLQTPEDSQMQCRRLKDEKDILEDIDLETECKPQRIQRRLTKRKSSLNVSRQASSESVVSNEAEAKKEEVPSSLQNADSLEDQNKPLQRRDTKRKTSTNLSRHSSTDSTILEHGPYESSQPIPEDNKKTEDAKDLEDNDSKSIQRRDTKRQSSINLSRQSSKDAIQETAENISVPLPEVKSEFENEIASISEKAESFKSDSREKLQTNVASKVPHQTLSEDNNDIPKQTIPNSTDDKKITNKTLDPEIKKSKPKRKSFPKIDAPVICKANESAEKDSSKKLEQSENVRTSSAQPISESLVEQDMSSSGAAGGIPAQPKSEDKKDEPSGLIFSGEYTKAMNKDWHSGHFCCWQCDESLTGQRYVLRDEHPYCIKCYESVFANGCEECNKTIGIDSKDLSYKDKHWHEACFLCNKCRVSLVDKQFGSKLDKIFCGNCYDAQFASRCDGCGQIFKAGTKKMEYKTRQWHEPCFACCVCKTPIGTKSFIPREQEIYCATCYEEKFATRCVKCNKIITSGGVTYKNEPWHRECFTCTNCNTSLAGQRFTSRDEKPYCADCFGELFAKRCTACCKPITGIGGTRFISFEDRHWHNDCFICATCKTSLVGRGFITDAEDIICPECAKQKLM